MAYVPEKAIDHPFETWREAQAEALKSCKKAIDSGIRFIVLEGPCGTGKSGVAVELARYLGGARILTSQVLLQEQYASDYPEFKVVKGTSRYSCNGECPIEGEEDQTYTWSHYPYRQGFTTCSHSKWKDHVMGTYTRCYECPYVKARESAVKSPYSILNYHGYYYVNRVMSHCYKDSNLILDEAHNLNGITTGLYTRIFRPYQDIFPKISSLKEEDVYDKSRDSATILNTDLIGSMLEDYVEDVKSELKRGHRPPATLQTIRELMSQAKYRLENDDSRFSVYTLKEDRRGRFLEVVPINAAPLVKRTFYDDNKTIILMSATVIDLDIFCREAGLSPKEVHYVRMPDQFPSENHVVRFSRNKRDMSFKARKGSLPHVRDAVIKILDKHHDDKGIIHGQTHDICEYLVRSIRDPRLTYDRDRNAALREHKVKDYSVLVSPSMKEGFDLKGELSRFQILMTVPYPAWNHKVLLKRKINPGFYEWAARVDFVQSIGRSVRTGSDVCSTYLMDSRFSSLLYPLSRSNSKYLRDILPFSGERWEV